MVNRDGPKAGTSGASEAAWAKPGARTGVCFVYPNWEKPAQWDRRKRPRLNIAAREQTSAAQSIAPLYCFVFIRFLIIFLAEAAQYESLYRRTAHHASDHYSFSHSFKAQNLPCYTNPFYHRLFCIHQTDFTVLTLY